MIGVGVVGYGYWGPNLARVIGETDGCRLAAIADASPAAAARAAKRHASAAIMSDWRALVARADVDAVVVATPVHTHFDIALEALRAGKHVLVEKPMTQTARQAEILIDAAARRGLALMVDHTFVYTPEVQKIKSIVESGDAGEIFYYDSTRINLGMFQSDVNVIWDLAVHDLAILDSLFGLTPLAVSASGAGHILGSPENLAHVTIFFEGAMTAHLNVNWLAPVKVRQTFITGSRKMIVYDDLQPSEKVKVYDRGVTSDGEQDDAYQRRVSYRVGDMWAPHVPIREALRTEFDHFRDCILTGSTPLTDGQSGLAVVRMLESATLSMRQRGHPIELELGEVA
ncbi:Gfo/Idh/MocA family protein [Methylopila sp. Yamaguchi]|uniref:Gfo/Idh/MocA family protein n=1 Tax=Methylopila sp. Yamaguchi TaxID=1437817 RepID=UPI000CBCC358|nr:Gfo/Idh/MocA family oxidoreductase [Methylopila sp. Yamaguchi]GBD48050.1 oxidoreductase domain-containing protein [Methylopila sp. Yamaguchi]